MPSGFANVTDNDLSELGLSVCGGGTSPTPQPTPPNVTPTPESGDATFDFLRNANCTEERLREIYGEDFTDENPDPPARVGYNSIGWASFFNTWWWNADRTKLVSCIAVLYDNADSAGFQRGFAELRRYGEGTTQDILFEKKLRGLPEIGWDYVAAWIEQGERRSEQDDGSFQDEIEVIKTAAVCEEQFHRHHRGSHRTRSRPRSAGTPTREQPELYGLDDRRLHRRLHVGDG